MSAPASDVGRSNQKARTRAALLHAAVALLREGRSPSIPEVADRALISVATAYRYFPSAEDLWHEASLSAVAFETLYAASTREIEAAGDDPVRRLEALVRCVGFAMLDDQAPFRRLARGALDQWFHESDVPPAERAPRRESRRRQLIAVVLEPLRRRAGAKAVEPIAHALTLVIGTDAMLAVVDGAGLEGEAARRTMLDAARWMMQGALAELDAAPAASRRRGTRRPAD